MSSRSGTVLTVSVVSGVAILGLAALGAASFGLSGLRFVGFAFLGAAGLVAAILRRRLERNDVDGEAIDQLETARVELERANPTAAGWAAARAVAAARTSRTRNRALTVQAWAALEQGYPERAKAALDAVRPAHAIDVYCLAAVECARGKTELAIQALEVARTFGTLTCDGAKLLVDCYLRVKGMEFAVLAALQNRKVLGRANCEQVLAAARLAGETRSSAVATLTSVLRNESPALPVIGGAHVG